MFTNHQMLYAWYLQCSNDESDGKPYPSDAKCWEGVVVDSLKMSSGDHDKFEEEKFMKILVNLKDTQESIQGFSGWCIKNRKAAYKMARCWIKVIKKVSLCLLMIISVLTSNIRLQVRIEQKLVLFYLVNDIVQHSAKRNYGELLDKFRSGIKEAMPHLKVDSRHFQVGMKSYHPFLQEEKIGPKVQRCLDIWEEREVFDSDFIQVSHNCIMLYIFGVIWSNLFPRSIKEMPSNVHFRS